MKNSQREKGKNGGKERTKRKQDEKGRRRGRREGRRVKRERRRKKGERKLGKGRRGKGKGERKRGKGKTERKRGKGKGKGIVTAGLEARHSSERESSGAHGKRHKPTPKCMIRTQKIKKRSIALKPWEGLRGTPPPLSPWAPGESQESDVKSTGEPGGGGGNAGVNWVSGSEVPTSITARALSLPTVPHTLPIRLPFELSNLNGRNTRASVHTSGREHGYTHRQAHAYPHKLTNTHRSTKPHIHIPTAHTYPQRQTH